MLQTHLITELLDMEALLMRYSFRQSMSRKGNPYDNAIMEPFYRALKRELVQDAGYGNPEQARQGIFQYVELYYNTKRIHSTLGWLSPMQFEAQNTQSLIFVSTFSCSFQFSVYHAV